MSVTLTTTISAPVENYPTIADFSAAVRSVYCADTETLVDGSVLSGNLISISSVAEISGGNYVETFTTVWIDQAALDSHQSDLSIQDEKTASESTFTVDRIVT